MPLGPPLFPPLSLPPPVGGAGVVTTGGVAVSPPRRVAVGLPCSVVGAPVSAGDGAVGVSAGGVVVAGVETFVVGVVVVGPDSLLLQAAATSPAAMAAATDTAGQNGELAVPLGFMAGPPI